MSIIVIGAGPAGMMAAITAAERGNKVILIEKNERFGRKLYISGKGRCNLTNDVGAREFLDNVNSNPKFLSGALYRFTPEDTKEYFTNLGLKLKTERGNRVFPVSDKSEDVIDCFARRIKDLKIEVHTAERAVCLITDGNVVTAVKTDKNTYTSPEAVIVATGGLSYPKTGSTGDGYTFARTLGHTVVKPCAALCPLVLKGGLDARKKLVTGAAQPFPEGLSLKNVTAKITDKRSGKILFEEFGEMLFTDKGVSGPIVLTLSCKINRKALDELLFVIDFKPAITAETLDARILREFDSNANKQFKNVITELMPKSLAPYFIALSGIDGDKPINVISRAERQNIVRLLKGMSFEIAALAPIDEAIVTAGGVKVKEIEPSTMRSKLITNLYFAGEVMDVDALTGGFNIQIAISTGRLAGEACQTKEN